MHVHVILAVKGFFLSEYTKTKSDGALPQTPLGEVTAFTQNPYMAGFNVACLPQHGERITGQKGRTRGGAVGKGRGKRGIAPWLLGEIDAPNYIYIYIYILSMCICTVLCLLFVEKQ